MSRRNPYMRNKREEVIRQDNTVRATNRPPLIAFALLFIFMGLWALVKFSVYPTNLEKVYEYLPETAWEKVKRISLENTKLFRALKPVTFQRSEAVLDITIPKDHRGEDLIKNALLVDYDSLTILWAHNEEDEALIASLTKMMLSLVCYVYADSGYISFYDTVRVTDRAPRIGGSSAFIDVNERYLVKDLIKAITVASSNDASYLMAEYIGDGEVPKTVALMNTFAYSLGLQNTRFYNVHGLPPSRPSVVREIGDGIGIQRIGAAEVYVATEANTSTAIDMARLCVAIIRLPELMQWSTITLDSLWDIDKARPHGARLLRNSFRIMGTDSIDGIKTGYTRASGFCVAATARRNGRRLIAIVLGSKHQNTRDDFVKHLFDKGYEYINAKEAPVDTLIVME